MSCSFFSKRSSWTLGAMMAVVALAVPAGALAAPSPTPSRQPVSALGSLSQLPGPSGCLVDRSKAGGRCTRVRALRGPAPFLGSHAVAVSPDGKNVYVASSGSHVLRQPRDRDLHP
jgi:DNA-binding beta-propeller fold protein YncE